MSEVTKSNILISGYNSSSDRLHMFILSTIVIREAVETDHESKGSSSCNSSEVGGPGWQMALL